MKKNFFLSFLLLGFSFFSQSNAQQAWAPDSAIWNHGYAFSAMSPPFDYNRHNIETRVIGDSLFQGQNCRVLMRTLFSALGGSSPYDTLFTYQDSFKVYFWNDYFNHFSLLFDFGVRVGDTVWLEGVSTVCPSTPSYAIVDSVGTVISNSDTLRYYVFEYSITASWTQHYRNIEKIGNLYPFLPYPSCVTDITGWNEGELYCYRDPQIGIFSTGSAPSCDYLLLGTEKSMHEHKCNIFSSENEWTIEGSTKARFTEAHLFNLSVKQEFEIIQNSSAQISIPKNDLPTGIYFFRVRLDSGEWFSGKLLKD